MGKSFNKGEILSGAEIKARYEVVTKAFTDDLFDKLDGLSADEVIYDGSAANLPVSDIQAAIDYVVPNNLIIVKEKAQFGAVVTDEIIISAKTYSIANDVNIGTTPFKYPAGGGTLNFEGAGGFNQQIIFWEGTGDMFVNVPNNVEFLRFSLIAIVAVNGGTFINGSAFPSNSLSQISILQCLIVGFDFIGTQDIRIFTDASAFVDNVNGIICNEVPNEDFNHRLNNSFFFNNSDLGTTHITFGGTGVNKGEVIGSTITTFANETAFKLQDSMAAGSIIKINSTVSGAGNELDPTGLDQKDARVIIKDTGLIPDSQTIGSFISQGNDIATVISVAGQGEDGYVDLDLGEASGSITAYVSNGSGGTTVTSNAHSQPDEKLIEIAGTTSYNGRHELFNVTTNTYDISIPFVADDATGSWTAGAFPDIDIEGWAVINQSNGEIEYLFDRPFAGNYIATISAQASGGAAKRYKFRLVRSEDAGVTFQDGFAIPNEIRNTITETTYRRGLKANKGDRFKLQVANFSGGDTTNITIDTVSSGVK